MFVARGSIWGPSALPEFLTEQLAANGRTADDAGRCARLINEGGSGPDVAALFVDLGACKFLEGDIDGAIAAWRHALSSSDDAAGSRGLLNLGLLYEHLQLYSRAVGLLDAVASRDVDPFVAPAAMASARCFLAQGECERAMETMARLAQRTMAQEPDSPELITTLYGLGEVADAAGRADRAERAWRVAAAGPASDVQRAARDRLVSLLQHQGRLDEALDHLDTAASEDNRIAPSIAIDVADALAVSGDEAQARTLAASIFAVALDSSDQFRLAGLRWRCGLVNEAIDVLEALLRDDSHTGDGTQQRAGYLLGQIYAGYDMVRPAQAMFDRVVAADDHSWSPKAALALGDLHESEGDHDAAVRDWTRAAESPIVALRQRAASRLGHEAVESAPTPATESGASDAESLVESTASSVPEPRVEPTPPSIAASPSEPVVVVLDVLNEDDAFENHTTERPTRSVPDAAATVAPAHEVASNGASAFVSHLDSETEISGENPYALLAPDDEEVEISPSTRNPYAELAPDFDNGYYELPADIEPGDWESMLEDWPEKLGTVASDDDSAKADRPSAFSRYT